MSATKLSLTANGATAPFLLEGDCLIRVDGTIGGGTASLQIQLDDGSWEDIEDATALSETWHISLSKARYGRVNLAGATAPSVDCILIT